LGFNTQDEGGNQLSGKIRTIILALAILSIPLNLLAADDPMMGTWNLNVPKSQLGTPVPRSIVRKHIPIPGGVRVVQERVDAQGKASTGEFTVKFDGKDYPIGGDPFVDRLSLKRVDRYRVDGIGRKNDKIATTFRWQVSEDGKTLTYTTERLYPPERVGTIIQILDKQK
jgi:hypothetical protein